jgi:hypothetical protein
LDIEKENAAQNGLRVVRIPLAAPVEKTIMSNIDRELLMPLNAQRAAHLAAA